MDDEDDTRMKNDLSEMYANARISYEDERSRRLNFMILASMLMTLGLVTIMLLFIWLSGSSIEVGTTSAAFSIDNNRLPLILIATSVLLITTSMSVWFLLARSSRKNTIPDAPVSTSVEEDRRSKLSRLADFRQSYLRNTDEIRSLERRGIYNLIIGVAATVVSVFILGYSILTINVEVWDKHLMLIVPRIFLSLLIQSFAIFFLRLYSQSLRDIKYFHNELTNIEMRHVAIDYIQSDSFRDEHTADILLAFAKTERNFILKKDEKTVELDKFHTEAKMQDQLLELLKVSLGKTESKGKS